MSSQQTTADPNALKFGEPQFAYVVVRVGVRDPQGVEAYLKQLRPILSRFGGDLLLQCRPVALLLEGMDANRMLAIVRFKSTSDARRWFESEDYKEAKQLFRNSADVSMALFEGIYGF